MIYTKTQIGILMFTILYTIVFGVHYVQSLNFEFIAYIVLMVGLVLLIGGTLHITRFSTTILAGLSLWGLLHMMGGSVMTTDGVLYAYRIYPFYDGGGEFYILKFDQVVHAALYGVVGLMFLHLLQNVLKVKEYGFMVASIAVMAALGVSAINEIIEFIAVVFVPDNGVGGYFNTLLDIIFNLVGAVIAVVGYIVAQKLKR